MTLDPFSLGLEDEVTAAPRRLLNLAETALLARRDVRLTAERGRTMAELAETLSTQDRSATVIAREANGTEWTLSVGTVEAAQP
ncbi:hypothetical protein [Lentzea flaviverrucosa]|uniref:Uncharacterized protein n=1 Tax=Lentzea flaviverrucosa TaxID=200379 RepID=A0A1H9XKG4_9PSEU|nr:hypothetical protein [Lentzea flaviverrucosa]RDI20346.1 hypothetical protein DFR72_115189 [Lentzea flaviverrucosa]SES46688.1 hypothetical protein SAMN05216195_115189 [Lentzea flaviverrucosa]